MSTNSKSGPNSITGTSGNDHLNGGSGNDIINGMGGNDRINAGSGNDIMDGGSGNDIVSGDAGDDLGIYVLSENIGSTDVYDGGSGVDTLQLVLTRAQWQSPAVQADIARFLTFLAQVTNPVNGQATNANFTFSFGLTVSKFEALKVVVDGVAFDPRDEAVTLVNDVMSAGEETASVSVNVLANDSVPDLIATLTNTQPSHGTVTLTRTTGSGAAADAASFVYTPNAAHWQYLAAGQTATDTFTYTVTDSDGDTRTATVTVTITGTNDVPTITAADTSGSILEDSASQGGVVGTATLVITEAADQGVRVIDRADLRIAPNPNLGDTGQPSIAVTGTVSAEGEQDRFVITLRAGEIITLDVDFAAGFGSGPQPGGYEDDFGLDSEVLIYDSAGNLLNINDDAPVTSGGAGSPLSQDSYLRFTAPADGQYTVVVRGYATGTPGFYSTGAYTLNVSVDAASNATLTDTGTVAFADVDLSDGHSVTVVSNGSGYLGALTAVVSNPSSGDGAGEVTWTYAVPNPAIQFLAVGQTLTQSYTLRVADGQGGTVDQVVHVTLTGTNDAPNITSNQANRTLTEGGAASTTGVMTFGDVDLTDGHIVSVTPVTSGNLGTFVASVSDASTGDGSGAVTWTFQVDPAEIEYLSLNQGRQQRYSVMIADGNGGMTEQLVIITIRGTNDRPTITAAVSTGSVVEDGAVTAAGTVAFGDVDLRDAHTATSTANGSGYLGTFTTTVTDNGLNDGAGSLTWNFSVNNAAIQYLAAGQTLTQTYTIAVTDNRGGTVNQPVTVTITGTNDAPVANADIATTNEDTPVTFDVRTNDTDVDGASRTVTHIDGSAIAVGGSVNLAAGGQVALNANGTLTYTPAANANGARTFDYTISDGQGGSATSTVSLTINPVSDPKVLFIDDDYGLTGESTWLATLSELGYDADYVAISRTGNVPSDLSQYDVVIWSVGDRAYDNLTTANVATLQAYLDGGGSVLYAGGHSVYQELQATSFIQNYLGVGQYQYNMPMFQNGAQPILATDGQDNVSLRVWAGGEYDNMLSAFNVIAPTARALLELVPGNYSSSSFAANDIASINDTGTFRAALWGFDLNHVDPANRAGVLRATLDALTATAAPQPSGAPVLSAKDLGPVVTPPAGDDTLASSGKAGDAPVVLPGSSDVSAIDKAGDAPVVLPVAFDDLDVDTRAATDRSINRDGDPSLTVMDDGGILGDPDGSFDFGLGDADSDVFVVTGELVDTPLVLPREAGVDRFDISALSDLFTGRDGDLPLAVMDDGQILGGEPWIDTSGLYNWA